ncbi:MAG TPA: hypothetical protein VMU66_05830 [Gaiellales bacterium]|nr:hypothetical protein [Gaiellales bacterium]
MSASTRQERKAAGMLWGRVEDVPTERHDQSGVLEMAEVIVFLAGAEGQLYVCGHRGGRWWRDGGGRLFDRVSRAAAALG